MNFSGNSTAARILETLQGDNSRQRLGDCNSKVDHKESVMRRVVAKFHWIFNGIAEIVTYKRSISANTN